MKLVGLFLLVAPVLVAATREKSDIAKNEAKKQSVGIRGRSKDAEEENVIYSRFLFTTAVVDTDIRPVQEIDTRTVALTLTMGSEKVLADMVMVTLEGEMAMVEVAPMIKTPGILGEATPMMNALGTQEEATPMTKTLGILRKGTRAKATPMTKILGILEKVTMMILICGTLKKITSLLIHGIPKEEATATLTRIPGTTTDVVETTTLTLGKVTRAATDIQITLAISIQTTKGILTETGTATTARTQKEQRGATKGAKGAFRSPPNRLYSKSMMVWIKRRYSLYTKVPKTAPPTPAPSSPTTAPPTRTQDFICTDVFFISRLLVGIVARPSDVTLQEIEVLGQGFIDTYQNDDCGDRTIESVKILQASANTTSRRSLQESTNFVDTTYEYEVETRCKRCGPNPTVTKDGERRILRNPHALSNKQNTTPHHHYLREELRRSTQENLCSDACPAPLVADLVAAYNDTVTNFKATGDLQNVAAVTDNFAELKKVECSRMITEFMEVITVSFDGDPSDAELRVLESAIVDAYNSANALNTKICDLHLPGSSLRLDRPAPFCHVPH